MFKVTKAEGRGRCAKCRRRIRAGEPQLVMEGRSGPGFDIFDCRMDAGCGRNHLDKIMIEAREAYLDLGEEGK